MRPELPMPQARMAPHTVEPASRRALRTIAGFEAFKGLVALAASMGFLSLLHRDLHHIATSLIGQIGLDPGGHYPAIILNDIGRLRGADVRSLLLAAAAYVLLRFLEAYGLWHERAWGEWLGALSGALYIPFELQHLIHKPTLAAAAAMTVNVVVVGYLAWRLRQRKRSSSPA